MQETGHMRWAAPLLPDCSERGMPKEWKAAHTQHHVNCLACCLPVVFRRLRLDKPAGNTKLGSSPVAPPSAHHNAKDKPPNE